MGNPNSELDDILSDEDVSVQEISSDNGTDDGQVQQPAGGQPRDPQGKFAKDTVQPEPAGQDDDDVAPDQNGMVPHQTLHAQRERAKALRAENERLARELAEARRPQPVQQQPAAPVEPPKPAEKKTIWDDPDAFVAEQLTPIQQEVQEVRLLASRINAMQNPEIGLAGIDAAETALRAEIQAGRMDGAKVAEQLRQSRDPVGDIVRWHQNSPENREKAMRERLRAELLEELGQQQPGGQQQITQKQPTNVTRLPPSLNRLPSGGNAPGDDDDSDAGIFNSAMQGR